MYVTVEDLIDTISTLYTGSVYVTEDNKIVVVKLACGKHIAHVSLHLWNQLSDSTESQAIGISFVFMKTETEEFTVNHLETGEVGEFLIQQQRYLDWCSLEIQLEENSDEVIALFRTIGTSMEDLRLALEHDFASKLHEAMFHMAEDFELVAPAVVAFAGTASAEERKLQALLNLQTDGPAN